MYVQKRRFGSESLLLSSTLLGVGISRFLQWRAKYRSALVPSETLKQIDNVEGYGNIPYTHLKGQSKDGSIFFFHDSPGTLYQWKHLDLNLPYDSFSVSRPGYFGGPLSSDASRYYSTIIPQLIKNSETHPPHIVAFGMGSLHAITYANKHPTSSITLIAPYFRGMKAAELSESATLELIEKAKQNSSLLIDVGEFLMNGFIGISKSANIARLISNQAVPAVRDQIAKKVFDISQKDSKLYESVKWMMGYHPLSQNISGYLEDIRLLTGDSSTIDLAEKETLKLRNLENPVLIIHSPTDGVVCSETQTAFALPHIRNLEILALEEAAHMVFVTHRKEIEMKMTTHMLASRRAG